MLNIAAAIIGHPGSPYVIGEADDHILRSPLDRTQRPHRAHLHRPRLDDPADARRASQSSRPRQSQAAQTTPGRRAGGVRDRRPERLLRRVPRAMDGVNMDVPQRGTALIGPPAAASPRCLHAQPHERPHPRRRIEGESVPRGRLYGPRSIGRGAPWCSRSRTRSPSRSSTTWPTRGARHQAQQGRPRGGGRAVAAKAALWDEVKDRLKTRLRACRAVSSSASASPGRSPPSPTCC